MVFQLTRYLARKGLGQLSEGESQTLEGYMESNQRRQSLEWIRKLMVQHQKDFDEVDDRIYGRTNKGTEPENRGMDPPKGKQEPTE